MNESGYATDDGSDDDEPYYANNHVAIEHPTWFTNISLNGYTYWWIRCRYEYDTRGYSYWRVERSPEDPVFPFEFIESLSHVNLFDDLVNEMNSYLEDGLPPLSSLRVRRIWAWYPPVVTNQVDAEFVEYPWVEVYQQLLTKSDYDSVWLIDEQAD